MDRQRVGPMLFAVALAVGLLVGMRSATAEDVHAQGAQPVPPTGLVRTGYTGDRVGLLWEPAAASDVVAYNVYAAVQSDPFKFIRSLPAQGPCGRAGKPHVVLSRLYAGLHYEFYVTAQTADGRESAPSNVVGAGYSPWPWVGDSRYDRSHEYGCDYGYSVGCEPD